MERYTVFAVFCMFFKGKYGSMFLFDKIRLFEIIFFIFFISFFFFFFNWRVKVLKFTHIIYVMKNWSEFFNINVQK